VEDLQKASESANHENSILRAQVEKMSMELREYRKRLSLTNGNLNRTPSSGSGLPPYLAGKGPVNGGSNNPNDVNFQFEFPRFGMLPAAAAVKNAKLSISPPAKSQKAPSPVEKSRASPVNRNMSYQSTNSSTTGLTQTPLDSADMSGFSGLFSPSLLESVSKNSSGSFDFFGTTGSRSSTASNGQMSSNDQSTSHSSPSASSNSNRGPSSSCGTSPEPSMQSPAPAKPLETTLSTIGEERSNNSVSEGELTFCEKLNMACGNANNPIPRTMSESTAGTFNEPGIDFNGIDWFAQQNGNQFDPQLFGDYREPQENILSGEGFNDSFFNDAFPLPEFNSPFNAATSPATSRKDKQVEEEVVPGDDPSQLLTCNNIWYVSTGFTQLAVHSAVLTVR
jgi:AP-1-like transcription factor